MPSGSLFEALPIAPNKLEGRVAIVTGAGRGTGREIARTLARYGANTIIAEISEEGEAVAEEIQEEGGAAAFIQTDVADLESVARMTDEVQRRFGVADIVVNNAVSKPEISVLEMGVDLFDRVVATNLRGTFLMTKAFLPEMIERGSGAFVNIVATEALPMQAAFCASKRGVVGFTQSFSTELDEKGIRAVALVPGSPNGGGSREEAAAAALCLVTELGFEYDGEVVDGDSVLQRATGGRANR